MNSKNLRFLFALLAGSLLVLLPARAQEVPPLAQALNPDGTLNLKAGVIGSFDARGWRLVTDASGQPRFVAAGKQMTRKQAASVAADANWDARFYGQGVSGDVMALAVSGSKIYVGGWLHAADDQIVNGVVVWDGTQWAQLGGGIAGSGGALAVNGNDIYVGGSFTNAGSVAVNNIAKWNGSAWSALDDGVGTTNTGYVNVMVFDSNKLYVGGTFSNAGSMAVNNIAVWNGTTWSTLGTGVGGVNNYDQVDALAVNGSTVYAGGDFSTAGGVGAAGVAKWNGTSWSALGTGVNGAVYALALTGSDLYVGGSFSSVSGLAITNLAKWNGTSWSAVGGGVSYRSDYYAAGNVNALLVSGGNVYVAGSFNQAGSASVTNLAIWNGTSWAGIGKAADQPVSAIAISGGNTYAAGYFRRFGDVNTQGVAKWNGSAWAGLTTGTGLGLGDEVEAVLANGSDVYVAGHFIQVGSLSVTGIAKWNGSAWSALGTGLGQGDYSSGVSALALSGLNLYAAGSFTNAGNVSVNHAAKWDGSAWSALGTGIGTTNEYSTLNAIAVNGSTVYVGGSFQSAGGVPVNNIAQWDGATWSALGNGVSGMIGMGGVYALAVSGGNLYAGGAFTNAGTVTALNLAKWDGSTWSAVGGGVGQLNDISGFYSVHAIAVSGTNVYVGGSFTNAGAVAANNIARWDGNQWSALGAGMDYTVETIAISSTNVYAGGYFGVAGLASNVHSIAVWNGLAWAPLGSGVVMDVYTLSAGNGSVYVGGGFHMAGNKPAANFSIWQESAGTPSVATPTISPAGGTFTNTVTVTLSCATSGATIRYTANGTDPTAGSTAYSTPFAVTTSSTIKAKAFKTGSTASGVASADFTIVTTAATVATPTIMPAGGSFTNSVMVTLKCATPGATIRYTTDGSAPTSKSPQYKNTALTITNSVTLKVKAFKAKLADSSAALASFTIIPPPPLTITTISLPDGVVKAKYTGGTLAATGGTAPYKWSIASGKLPTGLTLNATTGIIAGKPTKAGTATFMVKVTDAKKRTNQQPLALTVNAVP